MQPTQEQIGYMTGYENLISTASTFEQVEAVVERSQSPTCLGEKKFKRATIGSHVDLVTLRSTERKSQRVLTLHGVARTKNGEPVEYWIEFDEQTESK